MNIDKTFIRLLKDHEGLLKSIAERYYRAIIPKEYVEDAAKLGFYFAYRNYSTSKNTKLSTYAYPYIKREVIDQQREFEILNLSFSDSQKFHLVDQFIKENYNDYKSEIDFSPLENLTDCSREQLTELHGFVKNRLFIKEFNKVEQDSELPNIEEMSSQIIIQHRYVKDASALVQNYFLNKEVTLSLNKLSTEEKRILNWLFGLNNRKRKNVSEIAEELNKSKTRVSQIRDEAYRKLYYDPLMRQIYLEHFYEGYYNGFEIDSYFIDN